MSSTNTIVTLNPLAASMRAAEQDPVYGRMYRMLNTNFIGSWGDAMDIYSTIRRDHIWKELCSLTAGKATKENKECAEALVEELRERLTCNAEMLPKAEAMVKAWAKGSPKGAPAKTAAKPKAKVVVNTFAALLEDSEEE